MSGQFWLAREQVEQLKLHVPEARGKPRADDRRVLSGNLFVLRRQDASAVYRLHKTLYDRFVRWSRLGCSAGPFATWLGPVAVTPDFCSS